MRDDNLQGRHTTTRRELIVLPGGGVVIDTPGMREIQMWATEDDLEASFSDIEELATQCRFSDCGHDTEGDCAINAAVDEGTLDPDRLESYLKLKSELEYIADRAAQGAKLVEKSRWKNISQQLKQIPKKP